MTSNEGNDTKEKELPPTDPAATGFGGAGPQHPAVQQQQQQLPQATAAPGGIIPQPPMMHLVNTINGPMLVPVSQNPPPPVSSVEKWAYFFVLESFLLIFTMGWLVYQCQKVVLLVLVLSAAGRS